MLGCGAPMLPMVGICHANRIGHDLAVPVLGRELRPAARATGGPGWKGIKAQARQAAARWALHGRWFHNDPEIVMAWGSDGRGGPDGYSLEESHTQAVVAALVGGPFLLADQLVDAAPRGARGARGPRGARPRVGRARLPPARPVRARRRRPASTRTRSRPTSRRSGSPSAAAAPSSRSSTGPTNPQPAPRPTARPSRSPPTAPGCMRG